MDHLLCLFSKSHSNSFSFQTGKSTNRSIEYMALNCLSKSHFLQFPPHSQPHLKKKLHKAIQIVYALLFPLLSVHFPDIFKVSPFIHSHLSSYISLPKGNSLPMHIKIPPLHHYLPFSALFFISLST